MKKRTCIAILMLRFVAVLGLASAKSCDRLDRDVICPPVTNKDVNQTLFQDLPAYRVPVIEVFRDSRVIVEDLNILCALYSKQLSPFSYSIGEIQRIAKIEYESIRKRSMYVIDLGSVLLGPEFQTNPDVWFRAIFRNVTGWYFQTITRKLLDSVSISVNKTAAWENVLNESFRNSRAIHNMSLTISAALLEHKQSQRSSYLTSWQLACILALGLCAALAVLATCKRGTLTDSRSVDDFD